MSFARKPGSQSSAAINPDFQAQIGAQWRESLYIGQGLADFDPEKVIAGLAPGHRIKVSMSDQPTRPEMEARLSATESRIEAAIARMEAKVAHLPSSRELYTSVFGTGLAVIGILVAIMAWGGQQFVGGAAIEKDVAVQNARLDRLEHITRTNNEQVSALLLELQKKPAQPQQK